MNFHTTASHRSKTTGHRWWVQRKLQIRDASIFRQISQITDFPETPLFAIFSEQVKQAFG